MVFNFDAQFQLKVLYLCGFGFLNFSCILIFV